MSGRPQRLPGPECRSLRQKYMIRKLLLRSLLTALLERCASCMPQKQFRFKVQTHMRILQFGG